MKDSNGVYINMKYNYTGKGYDRLRDILVTLLVPRMEDNDKVDGLVTSVTSVSPHLEVNTDGDSLFGILYECGDSNDLSALTSDLLEDDFREIEKVRYFFKPQNMNARGFVCEEKRKCLLVVKNMVKGEEKLAPAIPLLFPWYFREKPLSDDEVELLRLKDGEWKDVIERLDRENKIYEKIQKKEVMTAVNKWSPSGSMNKLNILMQQEQDIENKMYGLVAELQRLRGKKMETQMKILGIQQSIGQEDDKLKNELIDYLCHNQHIRVETANEDSMLFSCGDYLTYYDEEAASNIIQNTHSDIYLYSEANHEDTAMLLEAIFVRRIFRIKLCAAFEIGASFVIKPFNNFNFDWFYKGYIPNPHIDVYQCLGGYQSIIDSGTLDAIGLMEQCLAACKSLNVLDSPVMKKFVRSLFGTGSCIEYSGTLLNAYEAIDMLKKTEK